MESKHLSSAEISSNFIQRIANNTYPGRGIVIGQSTTNQWVQVYWIMGRSENSRNRIFTSDAHVLRTEAADPTQVEDPSLIIYRAMQETKNCYIVTNGSQTDVICQGLDQGQTFETALLSQAHEPDDPNFTPRISGCTDLRNDEISVKISLIKASPFDSNRSEHHFFHYHAINAGYGYAITTYQADGNPLPSFVGSPFITPLQGSPQQIADDYWQALNEENRISLAVKTIDPQSRMSTIQIINKYHSKTE
ncbi:MAG: inosine monophosphate cyclohydrolase [SAR324 cluster bacterium]|nr:inosine monophosphate cyclohydrolase [SAR324 cluster bacterium]